MTTEELEHIGRVVEAKLEAERELTKKLIHEEVEAAKKDILTGIEKGAEDYGGPHCPENSTLRIVMFS
jgi:hypothetical protein